MADNIIIATVHASLPRQKYMCAQQWTAFVIQCSGKVLPKNLKVQMLWSLKIQTAKISSPLTKHKVWIKAELETWRVKDPASKMKALNSKLQVENLDKLLKFKNVLLWSGAFQRSTHMSHLLMLVLWRRLVIGNDMTQIGTFFGQKVPKQFSTLWEIFEKHSHLYQELHSQIM